MVDPVSATAPEYIADSAEATMAVKRDGKIRVLSVAPLAATVLVLGDLSATTLRRLSRQEVSLDERSLDEAMAAQMHRDLVVEIDERAAEQARLLARTVEDSTRIAQAVAKRQRKAAGRRRRA